MLGPVGLPGLLGLFGQPGLDAAEQDLDEQGADQRAQQHHDGELDRQPSPDGIGNDCTRASDELSFSAAETSADFAASNRVQPAPDAINETVHRGIHMLPVDGTTLINFGPHAANAVGLVP